MQIDAVLEVEAGDPQIAIDFLVDNVNLSKSRLKDLMNKGGIWRVALDGERTRLRRAMSDIFVGEQIEIFYDEELLATKPVRPELVVDKEQYSIWNKPLGMPLKGNDWADFNCFERALELQFKGQRPLFWLNAFDYEASGLALIAHSRKAAAELSEQFNPTGFQSASMVARCDVDGEFTATRSLQSDSDEGTAKMDVEIRRYDGRSNRTTLTVSPRTGFELQIRHQLAEAGFPVVGDDENGFDDESYEVLRLKNVELTFECPVDHETEHVSLLK